MSSESSEQSSTAPAAATTDSLPQESQPQSLLQRVINSGNRELALLLPLILGFSTDPPSSTTNTMATADAESPNQDQNPPPTDQNPPPTDESELDRDQTPRNPQTENQQRERVILINPITQGMMVVEGSNLTSFFESLPTVKRGRRPASKASIEAMPNVEINEGEQGECSICLDEWEVGGNSVKEMPCKHRFHSDCIGRWLGIRGSCPICRYQMPVEEEDGERKVEEDEGERRSEREIWVSFSFQ